MKREQGHIPVKKKVVKKKKGSIKAYDARLFADPPTPTDDGGWEAGHEMLERIRNEDEGHCESEDHANALIVLESLKRSNKRLKDVIYMLMERLCDAE
jgi:hypothetical protein